MQAELPRELEAKYAPTVQEDIQFLMDASKLPEGFRVGDSRVVRVTDVYVDTPDARLLRHGYTLRMRRQDGKHLLTLKSLENLHGEHIQDRLEIEEPLAADFSHGRVTGLQGWHETIREIVVSITGQDPQLRPICAIRQTRHKQWIHGRASDSPMVELSMDQVAVSADSDVDPIDTGENADRERGIGDEGNDRTQPVSNHRSTQFLEIELELVDPDEVASFRMLLQWLEAHAELSPVRTSKLVSGLRAIANQPLGVDKDGPNVSDTTRVGIQPQMAMADACRLIWRRQMIEIKLNESGLRADQNIEYVHDMRVATRRARAAYVLFGEGLRRKQVRGHIKYFKKTARRLGAVRDLDVALFKLKRYRKELPEEERGALQPVFNHWRKERHKRFTDLCRWLDTDAYSEALTELDRFCRMPGGTREQITASGEPPPLNQVRHVLPGRILSRFEAVRRYETLFAQSEQIPLESLHSLRIDCKYLRYVLEFARDLLGPEGDILIDQLKELQDVLGDLNDAAVARARLLALPKHLRTMAVTGYVQEQESISNYLRAAVPASFETFIDYENRHLLMSALAHL